jgi:integrase
MMLDKVDPIEAAQAEKRAQEAAAAVVVTFQEAAERYIERRGDRWRNERSATAWESSLRMWAYPTIGKLPVSAVERAHIVAILQPMWTNDQSGRLVTATRLRGRIEKIMDFAAMSGWRPEGPNPAVWKGKLEHVLPEPSELRKLKPVEHHPAIPVGGIGAFLRDLRAKDTVTARCLEFTTLNASRSGEARGARWPEFDLERDRFGRNRGSPPGRTLIHDSGREGGRASWRDRCRWICASVRWRAWTLAKAAGRRRRRWE